MHLAQAADQFARRQRDHAVTLGVAVDVLEPGVAVEASERLGEAEQAAVEGGVGGQRAEHGIGRRVELGFRYALLRQRATYRVAHLLLQVG
ncbi:hypothetical protein SDC9_202420 [bioreactor metagenome]|uniref:Uncharacterized protein n=1 Tax=bioreactor metagenome TaxID=1076179 RepID=A0A645J5L0_9ZZZZ